MTMFHHLLFELLLPDWFSIPLLQRRHDYICVETSLPGRCHLQVLAVST